MVGPSLATQCWAHALSRDRPAWSRVGEWPQPLLCTFSVPSAAPIFTLGLNLVQQSGGSPGPYEP